MFAIAATAALLAAQASTATPIESTGVETREVGYETIAAGEARAAIAQLEAARAENPGDPALLINLGAAYAAVGEFELAQQAYREAIASKERYELELANGDWIDSRRAARMALLSLEQAGRQAE